MVALVGQTKNLKMIVFAPFWQEFFGLFFCEGEHFRASIFADGSRLGFVGRVEESQVEVVTCPTMAWAGRTVSSNLTVSF